MSEKPVLYHGYVITRKFGGYVVTKVREQHALTSQPSLSFAQSWIDQHIRDQPAVEPDRIELQNVEFRAARAMCQALHIHDTVAVVDDGYPEVRHKYESTVKTLLDAFRANGRIL
jgi:hypothetical protein